MKLTLTHRNYVHSMRHSPQLPSHSSISFTQIRFQSNWKFYSTASTPASDPPQTVVVLLGWLGCSHRILNKYSQIYHKPMRAATQNTVPDPSSRKKSIASGQT